MSGSAVDLVERVVAHAGGAERWDALEALEAHIRIGGLAFKTAGILDRAADIDLVLSVHEPRVELRSRARPGWNGLLEGTEARLVDDDGHVLAARPDAITVRRLPWPSRGWDDLEAIAFCTYAAWNYLTFPVLLRRPDIGVEALGPHSVAGERLEGLRLSFPPGVPTHGPSQVLWVGPDGALRRHDYLPVMVSPLAHAANIVLEETTAFGVTLPCRRRVVPQLPRRGAAPGPLLVSIELELTGVRER